MLEYGSSASGRLWLMCITRWWSCGRTAPRHHLDASVWTIDSCSGSCIGDQLLEVLKGILLFTVPHIQCVSFAQLSDCWRVMYQMWAQVVEVVHHFEEALQVLKVTSWLHFMNHSHLLQSKGISLVCELCQKWTVSGSEDNLLLVEFDAVHPCRFHELDHVDVMFNLSCTSYEDIICDPSVFLLQRTLSKHAWIV